jgi:hypothetical protein
MGIGPYYTLNDVMAIFPKANYEKLGDGWPTNKAVSYRISGEGVDGEVLISFEDIRTFYLEESEKVSQDATASPFFGFLSSLPEARVIEVDSVRWTPANPIPIANLLKKYGKPSQHGEKLALYWKAKEVLAYISPSGKTASSVEYRFTWDEKSNRVTQMKNTPLRQQMQREYQQFMRTQKKN